MCHRQTRVDDLFNMKGIGVITEIYLKWLLPDEVSFYRDRQRTWFQILGENA